MSPTDLIDKLNQDLANEYKHWHFYLNAAIRVQGLHRAAIREFLLSSAKSEMEHILAFGDLILGLGGVPSPKVNGFRNDVTDPKTILEYALQMETEVVNNYIARKNEAHQIGGVMGARVEIFLDSQIEDNGMDADNIRQMLMGIPA